MVGGRQDTPSPATDFRVGAFVVCVLAHIKLLTATTDKTWLPPLAIATKPLSDVKLPWLRRHGDFAAN